MITENIVKDYFSEHVETFTIYVVEQKFANYQGKDFFKQYIGTKSFIKNNIQMKKHLTKVVAWIQKKIPDIAELTKSIITTTGTPSPTNIADVITSLSKLFSITEHQAVGPDVIDPIIIEEINISAKYISQLVALYKESILQPAIIIILKDNNFERAKDILSKCPHNTNIKFIRNSGETVIYKVLNTGADDIISFIEAFANQCFSTCSKTKREILIKAEQEEGNIIKALSPYYFKTRTNLLYDEKPEAITDVNYLINRISMERKNNCSNETMLNSLELMAKLNRIYCNDFGGTDIGDVLAISSELDIDILKAHVYRFAHFIPNITRERQKELLQEASKIFTNNNVADHAMYCQNNFLVQSFYTDRVNTREFHELQQRAINDVPGMVGMSIILNNVGVAYLYTKNYDEAVIFLKKGLDYSKERLVQKLGLESNLIIARACSYENIAEKDIRILFERVLAVFSRNYLPFIGANYIMNLLNTALEQHYELGKSMFENAKVHSIVSTALKDNSLGSGSLTQQIVIMQSRFHNIDFSVFCKPSNISKISGIRAEFIMEKGYNPIIFNAWL